jgi:hypothetical protein
MSSVKTSIDVENGATPEDRCTNAFVLLLQRCSPEITRLLLGLSGLTISDVRQPVVADIQHILPYSRPDAILEFAGPQYVVLETKVHPGMCSELQLRATTTMVQSADSARSERVCSSCQWSVLLLAKSSFFLVFFRARFSS